MGANALFRCDASARLGAGHLARCLAFAETLAWAGWSTSFATNREACKMIAGLGSPDVKNQVCEDAVPSIDAQTSLCVLDHYQLDATYERQLAAAGRTVIVFDDLADRPHDCDILVDPSPGRQASAYVARVRPPTKLLLGSRYALIRRGWRSFRNAVRDRASAAGDVRRILVSMGATDPSNATSRVIAALRLAGLPAHIDVVLGEGAPHLDSVAAEIGTGMTLHVGPTDLPRLCAQADLAVGAPGTSSFERAVLGLPAIMVPVADNQRFLASAFAAAGAAEVLPGDILDTPNLLAGKIAALAGDHSRRLAMAAAAARLVDGRGPARLLTVSAGAVSSRSGEIRLRLAESEDEKWLLALQWQPATRRFAGNPQKPNETEHAQWLADVLEDDERLLMIVELDDHPVGMVRLDRLEERRTTFAVSIAIDERWHGRRIAAGALALIRRMAPCSDFIATILPENKASLALFASAGYQAIGGSRYWSPGR